MRDAVRRWLKKHPTAVGIEASDVVANTGDFLVIERSGAGDACRETVTALAVFRRGKKRKVEVSERKLGQDCCAAAACALEPAGAMVRYARALSRGDGAALVGLFGAKVTVVERRHGEGRTATRERVLDSALVRAARDLPVFSLVRGRPECRALAGAGRFVCVVQMGGFHGRWWWLRAEGGLRIVRIETDSH